ncbi:MAG: chitobiase/beta-hexosaminidase C-terminal domain-containing protein [Muribaculaceae bacterium]|nr:chitobiase/beta-hexosaminidase C-terminal domain-containing protein [Muribaculaceae bacterium]
MKKTFRRLCIVALLTLCVQPALAQLNGTGFYRFRNVARPTEYISITNDRFNYYTIIDDAGGGTDIISNNAAQQRAVTCSIRFLQNDIHMVEDPDIIDLASVIYADKKNTNPENYDYNLIGQGTSLLTLTTGSYRTLLLFFPVTLNFENLYVSLNAVNGDGADTQYTASMPLKASGYGDAGDLGDRYFVDQDGKFDTDVESVASQTKARWYIEPVTHFNVQPEVGLNGKWYTTLKVPFAVTLSGKVEKAYTITANNGGILEFEEISGTIPAGTPVILQCGSSDIADCQLIPAGAPVFTSPSLSEHTSTTGVPAATDNIAPTSNNLLIGTYYCNTDGTLTYPKASGSGTINGDHYQAISSKYELGITEDGQLGFVQAKGITTPQGIHAMPANKAWMNSTGLFPTVATPSITPASGSYAEVQTVTITAEEGTTILYSTDNGTTWNEYVDAIEVGEGTTTISAKAIKAGPYNDSKVATAEYVVEIPVTVVLGDVNDDGIVNIADVTKLIDYLLDNSATPFNRNNADVKQDGNIDIADVTSLIDMLLNNPATE